MKDFSKLSKRQKHILSYMEKYIEEQGYPPTIREIGLATGINSTSVVNYNLNKLVQAGYLERSDRVSRGMRLVSTQNGKKNKDKTIQMSASAINVPLRGKIVAGEPVPAYDSESDEIIEVTSAMLGKADSKDVFALQVNGDSMIDAMIADGDIVLLRRQETANNGDMVAVWIASREETTLKYFYNEGTRIRLQPANPYMDPIYEDAANCHIQGKVVSVLRQVR